MKIILMLLFLFIALPAYSESDEKGKENVEVNIFALNGQFNLPMFQFSVGGNYYLGNKISLGAGVGVSPSPVSLGSIKSEYRPFFNANLRFYFMEPINFSIYTQSDFNLLIGFFDGTNVLFLGQILGLEKRFSNTLILDLGLGFHFLRISNFLFAPNLRLGLGFSFPNYQ